ncbi:hypothetical protein [Hydrogenovibrio halophilus]|uniref:hypothetical protein n=1 Tax=Hydrogenovibrio halophilus TaxID=373391 RepID=UPI0003649CD2|nr:hypothetical protein [Hydrogenovibrio halophilus]
MDKYNRYDDQKHAIFNKLEFCSGFGQHHTNKPKAEFGKPYKAIGWDDIRELLANPNSTDKKKAQWVIFSDQTGEHGRNLAFLRDNALYGALWADIDETGFTIGQMEAFIETLGVYGFVYTTTGATKQAQKFRLIFPLAEQLGANDFERLQKILNRKLINSSITPDRATERANQVCYLPNRGEYYDYRIVETDSFTDEPLPYASAAMFKADLDAMLEAEQVEKEQQAEQRKQSQIKAAQRMASGQSSPVDAFNAEFGIELMLTTYGYAKDGKRYLSPNSGSGSPGVEIKNGKWLSSHESDAALGIGRETNGGCMGDAFDLYVHYEHGGDYDAAVKAAGAMFTTPDGQTITKANQRAYMEAQNQQEAAAMFENAPQWAKELSKNGGQSQPETQPSGQPTANTGSVGDKLSPEQKAAASLVDEIEQSLKKKLKQDGLREKLNIDPNVILKMISGSFWSGQKSKLFLLGYHGGLVQYSEKDGWKFLAKNFGKALDSEKLNELATVKAESMEKGAQKAFIGLVNSIPKTAIMDYIKFHNQRDSIEMRVDMFTGNNGYVKIMDEKARVVYPHIPFEKPLPQYDNAVIEDYKQHFKRLDEFLELVVMARFARDRKKAYLWMLAHSDWGKGFLLGVFKQMGLVVDLSIKEIESIFEGKPVGRSMQDFKRAFILAVDEFKAVKSEIKQLQSEISLAPKNQLSQSVEVFLKLFLSAESVASLVGEYGVEDQFANRFSIFDEKGTLEDRPMFHQVGKAAYFDNVQTYVASVLNNRIDEMVNKGKQQAEKECNGLIKLEVVIAFPNCYSGDHNVKNRI